MQELHHNVMQITFNNLIYELQSAADLAKRKDFLANLSSTEVPDDLTTIEPGDLTPIIIDNEEYFLTQLQAEEFANFLKFYRNREALAQSEQPYIKELKGSWTIAYKGNEEINGDEQPGDCSLEDWKRHAFVIGENKSAQQIEDTTDLSHIDNANEQIVLSEVLKAKYEEQLSDFFKNNLSLLEEFKKSWNQQLGGLLKLHPNYNDQGQNTQNFTWLMKDTSNAGKLYWDNNKLKLLITHKDLHFLNIKSGKRVKISGEVNYILEMTDQGFALVSVNSSNEILDDIVMGKNIGPLALAQIRSEILESLALGYKIDAQKLSTYENSIQHAIFEDAKDPQVKVGALIELTIITILKQIGDNVQSVEIIKQLLAEARNFYNLQENDFEAYKEKYLQKLTQLEHEPTLFIDIQLILKHHKESIIPHLFLEEENTKLRATAFFSVSSAITSLAEESDQDDESSASSSSENITSLTHFRSTVNLSSGAAADDETIDSDSAGSTPPTSRRSSLAATPGEPILIYLGWTSTIAKVDEEHKEKIIALISKSDDSRNEFEKKQLRIVEVGNLINAIINPNPKFATAALINDKGMLSYRSAQLQSALSEIKKLAVGETSDALKTLYKETQKKLQEQLAAVNSKIYLEQTSGSKNEIFEKILKLLPQEASSCHNINAAITAIEQTTKPKEIQKPKWHHPSKAKAKYSQNQFAVALADASKSQGDLSSQLRQIDEQTVGMTTKARGFNYLLQSYRFKRAGLTYDNELLERQKKVKQVKSLAVTKAFSSAQIGEARAIAEFNKLGHMDLANNWQKQYLQNIQASQAFQTFLKPDLSQDDQALSKEKLTNYQTIIGERIQAAAKNHSKSADLPWYFTLFGRSATIARNDMIAKSADETPNLPLDELVSKEIKIYI